MSGDLTLLVHAGAPSGRKDDERFVAQAEAYLDFVDADVARILVDPNQQDEQQPFTEHSTTRLEDPTVFDDTQLAVTALESQLISSSLAAALASQAKRRREADETTYLSSLEEWQVTSPTRSNMLPQATPLKTPSDVGGTSTASPSTPSSPTLHRRGTSQRCRKKPRLDFVPSSEVIPSSDGLADRLPQHAAEPHTHRPQLTLEVVTTQIVRDSFSGDETTSELPMSYSLSDISSDLSKDRVRSSQNGAGEVTPTASGSKQDMVTILETSHPAMISKECATAASGPKAAMPSTFKIPEQPVQPAAPPSNPSDAMTAMPSTFRVPEKPVQPVASPKATSGQDLLSLPTTIPPRVPETSLKQFTTHVTKALHFLAENFTLREHFNPLFISRDLSPLERGHWLIPCDGWSADLRLSFWQYLKNSVANGNVGWGVWCARGPEEPLPSQASPFESSLEAHGGEVAISATPIQPAFGPVRVYCWGEIVEHMYLLLYTASRSRVRRQGLQWIDAQGIVVVQMRGQSTSGNTP